MNSMVFDSSAILALYYNEPGKNRVRTLLDRSEPLISTVNLCELFSKLLDQGLSPDAIEESFNGLEIEAIEFDQIQALKAAELRKPTKQFGLSLGDRACLALGILTNSPVVTADKSWDLAKLAKIELIR